MPTLCKIRSKGECGGTITAHTTAVQCPRSYTSAPIRPEDGLYLNTCPDGHVYASSLNLVGHRCYQILSTTTTYSCDVCGTTYSATGTCTQGIKRDYLEAH